MSNNNFKILVLGDSFSADNTPGSWVSTLGADYQVENLSVRGSSQYRLYKLFLTNLKKINQADAVIFFHTNPERVYLPDSTKFSTRNLASHTQCDLVANDSLNDPQWSNVIKLYYKYFFDDDMQADFYNLMLADMQQKIVGPKILNCSGFDIHTPVVQIKSFSQIFGKFPGNINHLNLNGNDMVYKYIISEINNYE